MLLNDLKKEVLVTLIGKIFCCEVLSEILNSSFLEVAFTQEANEFLIKRIELWLILLFLGAAFGGTLRRLRIFWLRSLRAFRSTLFGCCSTFRLLILAFIIKDKVLTLARLSLFFARVSSLLAALHVLLLGSVLSLSRRLLALLGVGLRSRQLLFIHVIVILVKIFNQVLALSVFLSSHRCRLLSRCPSASPSCRFSCRLAALRGTSFATAASSTATSCRAAATPTLGRSTATLRVLISSVKEGVLELLNQGIKAFHSVIVRLKQVFHGLWFLLVEGKSLEARVELLDRGVLKVARIEVDGHVLDQELGRVLFVLGELVKDTLAFLLFLTALSLVTGRLKDLVDVSDVVGIGQEDTLEARRSLEAIFLVDLLFLGD